jgi:hypothetical protein
VQQQWRAEDECINNLRIGDACSKADFGENGNFHDH